MTKEQFDQMMAKGLEQANHDTGLPDSNQKNNTEFGETGTFQKTHTSDQLSYRCSIENTAFPERGESV